MILDKDGKPFRNIETPAAATPSAEERFFGKKKQIDAYRDPVFIRHIVHKFQSIEPQVGAVFYPHTESLVFWYYGIIIYKVMMNEHNVDDVSMLRHAEKFRMALAVVKSNPELRRKLQAMAAGAEKKFGKAL